MNVRVCARARARVCVCVCECDNVCVHAMKENGSVRSPGAIASLYTTQAYSLAYFLRKKSKQETERQKRKSMQIKHLKSYELSDPRVSRNHLAQIPLCLIQVKFEMYTYIVALKMTSYRISCQGDEKNKDSRQSKVCKLFSKNCILEPVVTNMQAIHARIQKKRKRITPTPVSRPTNNIVP